MAVGSLSSYIRQGETINRSHPPEDPVTIVTPLLCSFLDNVKTSFNNSLLKCQGSDLAALVYYFGTRPIRCDIPLRPVTSQSCIPSLMSWGSHAKPLILIMIQHIVR